MRIMYANDLADIAYYAVCLINCRPRRLGLVFNSHVV